MVQSTVTNVPSHASIRGNLPIANDSFNQVHWPNLSPQHAKRTHLFLTVYVIKGDESEELPLITSFFPMQLYFWKSESKLV